jgi:flagellar biogenesis protein FliO
MQTVKDLVEIAQNLATILALLIGGIWAWRRFVREEADYAHTAERSVAMPSNEKTQ